MNTEKIDCIKRRTRRLQIYTNTATIQSNADYIHTVRHIGYHTLSMPPRLVTSTKKRCKSSGLPPMVGILQSREQLNLTSE